MRKSLSVMFVLLCLLTTAKTRETTPKRDLRIRVSLVDGSRVIGTTDAKAIGMDIGFADLTVPLNRIMRIDRVEESRRDQTPLRGVHRIRFENDDVLTGVMLEKSLSLRTMFDTLDLRIEHIDSIEILPDRGAQPIRRGLLIDLPFDNDVDGGVEDQSQNSYSAEPREISIERDMIRGRVAKFGCRSSIEIAHDNTLCSGTFSIGGWIYLANKPSGYQMVAAKTNQSSWYGGYGLYCYPGDPAKIYFFVNNYSSTSVNATLPVGRWTHIMGVSGDGVIQLFVDGKKVGERLISPVEPRQIGSDLITNGLIHHVRSPLTIGADRGHEAWGGMLDDFVMYGRALSPTEVKMVYQAGAHARTPVQISRIASERSVEMEFAESP